jgi:hypothetical protein
VVADSKNDTGQQEKTVEDEANQASRYKPAPHGPRDALPQCLPLVSRTDALKVGHGKKDRSIEEERHSTEQEPHWVYFCTDPGTMLAKETPHPRVAKASWAK